MNYKSIFNFNNLIMKNIKKFILEKLKVTQKMQHLPTWEEFIDALQHVPDKMIYLRDVCEEFNNVKIKDLPAFVNGGNNRYPKYGHISELLADYNTPKDHSICIFYFTHEGLFMDLAKVRLYAEDYKVLIDSLGEDLYLEIYNKMKELCGD